jgi:hypothetical protein
MREAKMKAKMNLKAIHDGLVAAEKALRDASQVETDEIEAARGQLEYDELSRLPGFIAWENAWDTLRKFESDLIMAHFAKASKVAPVQYALTMKAFKDAGMTLEQAIVSHLRNDLLALALQVSVR